MQHKSKHLLTYQARIEGLRINLQNLNFAFAAHQISEFFTFINLMTNFYKGTGRSCWHKFSEVRYNLEIRKAIALTFTKSKARMEIYDRHYCEKNDV
jgi:hypothetical protein